MGREPVGPVALPIFQVDRRILETLICQQLLHQFVSWVGRVFNRVGRVFLLARLGDDGHEHLALNLQQRRRHHQKLPRQIDVDRLNHFQVMQVLLGQLSHGDVVQIDLVSFDQI